MNNENKAKIFKALSDPKRLQMMEMLTSGELCACEILDHFHFTQPTLSHHIKILTSAGLVSTRKKGTWHYYSLNEAFIREIIHMLTTSFLEKKTNRLHGKNGPPSCSS